MKNLFFCLMAFGAFTLSSFTGLDSESAKVNFDNTVSCRWRTVYHHPNGATSYGLWTYGNCNQSEDGSLTPVQ